MSSNNSSSKVVTVDEQALKQADEQEVDDDSFPVVDETPEFGATVKQEVQAKVDANHPDGIVDTNDDRIHGVTLEQEERIQAREAELERISAQAEFGQQQGRAKRARDIAAQRSAERRKRFQKRAASVEPMADPERPDPRTSLTQSQLAAVNEQSMRLAERLDGWSRAAISRQLAEAVVDGQDLTSAVVSVFEELQTAPGQIVPIGKLEDVSRQKVSIEGRVETLWDPSHPSIAQVGLIADDSGQTRVTIWEKSGAPWIEEGERVRIHGAARNWYVGRVSLAVTGWSTIQFPERGRWWE
ncbi:SOSS complex subunit B family protein [Natrinema versiforme]|uniref:DNA-binding protein n=1 Tax=Natrinema versiforme TaxID=88724 RepID=A0A4V1G0B2_9EURY|nr:DNA-binding protein [Natrinema versiforme]QCS44736.1 DNA-binding protein [Natrinema versiforme]